MARLVSPATARGSAPGFSGRCSLSIARPRRLICSSAPVFTGRSMKRPCILDHSSRVSLDNRYEYSSKA